MTQRTAPHEKRARVRQNPPTIVYATAVPKAWCYCQVRYSSLQGLVLLLCMLLQSPRFGVIVA